MVPSNISSTYIIVFLFIYLSSYCFIFYHFIHLTKVCCIKLYQNTNEWKHRNGWKRHVSLDVRCLLKENYNILKKWKLETHQSFKAFKQFDRITSMFQQSQLLGIFLSILSIEPTQSQLDSRGSYRSVIKISRDICFPQRVPWCLADRKPVQE